MNLNDFFWEPNPLDLACFYSDIDTTDFLRLTDEMINTIIDLEEELVR